MPEHLSHRAVAPINNRQRLSSRANHAVCAPVGFAEREICFLVKAITFLVVLVVLQCSAARAQNPPSRPHILGIAQVKVSATNLPASLAFYSKTLNLAHDLHRTVPSETFFLDSFQDLWLEAVPAPNPTNLIAEITFSTDDVPAIRRYLVFHKIAVSTPINSTIGDYYLTVADPEGHRIGFVRPTKGTAGTLSSDPAAATGSTNSTYRLIHAGFVVHDRAAMDRFYKDILGFRPYWHGGMKDDETSWVAMQVPDGTDWVEYMLNISPTADKHTLGVMNHIALGVTDIQATKAQLLKNGWKPGEEPKLGRDGKWQLNLYDPDDTRVEFMEFTPKEKPCCSEFTGPHPGPKP